MTGSPSRPEQTSATLPLLVPLPDGELAADTTLAQFCRNLATAAPLQKPAISTAGAPAAATTMREPLVVDESSVRPRRLAAAISVGDDPKS